METVIREINSTDTKIKDVFNTFTEEQKQVVYFMIGKAIEETERRGFYEYYMERTAWSV